MAASPVADSVRAALSRAVLKPLADRVARPLLELRLRGSMRTQVLGLDLVVPPGVFHPGFFFSSTALARLLQRRTLAGLHVLDLGTGSGILALVAARKGALVTAVDINPAAVEAARENASRNGVAIHALVSDQFDAIDARKFDLIVVNPPYFEGDPRDAVAQAWLAGTGMTYFKRLFAALKPRVASTETLIILADNCDLRAIQRCAADEGLALGLVHSEHVLWEEQLIYRVVEARDGR